jgi:hypothetical protein
VSGRVKEVVQLQVREHRRELPPGHRAAVDPEHPTTQRILPPFLNSTAIRA